MTREIVFLPGALRFASTLGSVAALGRVVGYPGQGMPLIPKMDYWGMVGEIAREVDPEALVVGESLGGLFALGLPNPVVAIDPPLATGKLWFVRQSLVREARRISRPALTEMLFNIFGYHLDGRVEDRRYHHLLSRAAPTWVVAAALPHGPQDPDGPPPSLLDKEDRRLVMEAGVPLIVVDGPHNLINVCPDEITQIILQARDAHDDVAQSYGS